MPKKCVFPSRFPYGNGEWLGAESNRRHADFQSAALPTELPSRHRLMSILRLRRAKGSSVKQKTHLRPGYDVAGVKRSTSNVEIGTHQASNIENQTSLKFGRQFDRSTQETKIMIPRNLDAAKLFQMRCEPLRVQQRKFARV